jgi:hypothetical protein
MTATRRALAAFLATAFVAAPALAAPADANPASSKHLSAIACKASVCRLSVKVDGDCGISVDPEWLFISGKNVQLVWDILPAGYYFPPDGIRFKDEYNPAWRSEFYPVGNGEGGGDVLLTDASRAGPSRQSVWGDLNTQPDVFRYSVTIVNARTGQQCRADPGVVNDWD